MRIAIIAAGLLLALTASPARSQFADEDADAQGVLGPADFSWRYYLDHMDRFPERIGITCVNAYWLDKTGDHVSALRFFKECARRGNPPAMIYLSTFYEFGRGTPADLEEAARWLRRAAETGYSLGQFHYGVALLRGRGVPRDVAAGRAWIDMAVAQGDPGAVAFARAGYDLASLPGPDGGAPLSE